jgi:hypothetical protein
VPSAPRRDPVARARRRAFGAWAAGAAVWTGGGAAAAALSPQGFAPVTLWVVAVAGPALSLLAAGLIAGRAAALEARLAALEAGRAEASGVRPAPARPAGREPAARPAHRPADPAPAAATPRPQPGEARPARPADPPSSGAPPPAPRREAQGARAAPPAPAAADPGPAEPPPSWSDIRRALEFPRDEADEAGMAALRAAIRDPEVARLLQAAEDVLSILAGAGLHMEDLRPVHGGSADWLAYARGARGPAADRVGGAREPEALASARALLDGDPVFRDAAAVFVRRWNQLVERAAAAFPDGAPLPALADTRTGRAFMLLARATGAFDGAQAAG